jgi:hypothetical protein
MIFLGKGTSECVYCKNKIQISANNETKKEKRIEEAKTSKTIKRLCIRCAQVELMVLEEGPSKGWRIASCIECGKRHDIWN